MYASGGRQGLFAIAASLLMIVSMLPAGTASAGAVTETAGNTAPADTVPEVSIDGSPVILKAQAMERIENFSVPSNQLEAAKERARARLNDSFVYYQDPVRVGDQHAFIRDAEVLRALTDFEETNQSKRLDQIVELVTTADNQSARQVIRDAEYAFTTAEGSLSQGIYHSVKAHIDNARRELSRAERIRDRAAEQSGAQSIRTTARAVRTYGSAVNQAHTALRMIDGEIGLEVTLTRRTDPIRNGSERTQYTLVGNVTDPTGLDTVNVTATINDDRTVALPLRGGYANATFTRMINITERVNVIEIIAVESDDDQQSKNTKNKNKKCNDGNGSSSSGRSQASTVVLRLDGDGLPDTYEGDVTGTDPLNPDSNSTIVRGDQGGNDIIDSQHDFDADSVDNRLEHWFGSDPLSSDTDGDGLEDGFEIRDAETSPVKSDTDDDEVIDPEEDPDSDGLVNLREQTLGTDPHRSDSDSDQHTDSREQEIGTNATKADTDADGLEDGVEREFGTDPLDPDTNDNGVLDGNETYTTDLNNESLGVSVRVTAMGSIGKTVTIEENTETRFNNAYADNLTATPVVDLDTDESIENSTVSVSYDESDLSVNESELVGVRYNESIQGFEPLPTTIDRANDTVHTQTDHFSTFTVFKVPNWQKMLTAQEPSNGEQDEPATTKIDVMLVIDSSGSMNLNDPKEFRKVAAKEFVGALIEGDRAGVVDFDHSAEVTQELTTDFGSVNVTIESLDASGGTIIGTGLQRANDHFAANSNDSRAQYTILLTDGQGSGGISQAKTAADRGTTIYTIGFGNADGDKLQRIADITSGGYSSVDDASDLPDVFSRVAEDIEPTHSDGDGFSDSLENNGIPISPFMVDDLDNAEANLSANDIAVVYTDPEQNDTDGDTLHDDKEIGSEIDRTIEFYGNEHDIRYYTVKSDPTDPNSDDTGLNDSDEVAVGSDPMEEETLVAGYTVGTLSNPETPNKPATVAELGDCCGADSLSNSENENLVVSPVEIQSLGSNRIEVTVPVTVFFQTNENGADLIANDDINARLEADPPFDSSLVQGPSDLNIEPGESRMIRYQFVLQQNRLESLASNSLQPVVDYRIGLGPTDDTPFYRSGRDGDNGRRDVEVAYSSPGSALLGETANTVDTVENIYSEGIQIAQAAQSGTVRAESIRGAIRITIYEYARSELGEQLGTPPQSGMDLAQSAATEGIGAFGDAIRAQQGSIEANVTVSGPILIRHN